MGAKEKRYTVGETGDTGASEAKTLLEYHPSLLLDLSAFLPGPSMVQGVCGKPLLIPKCQRCAEEADSRDEVERGWGPRARQ